MGAFVLWESTPTEERLDLKSKGYDGFKSLLSYHCAVSEGRASDLQNRRTGLKSLTALQV